MEVGDETADSSRAKASSETAGGSKAARGLKATGESKATGGSKTTDGSKATDGSKVTDGLKATGGSKTTDSSKSTDSSKATDSPKMADSSEAQAKSWWSRFRILKLFAWKNGGKTSDAEHVAAVWAAYEEIGWLIVSEHFKYHKERRKETNIDEEMRIIRKASHGLSRMRQSSFIFTFMPAFVLAVSMISAIVKTFRDSKLLNDSRVGNETAHDIAVLCLLFVFMPLVIFSGSLGSFLTANGPVEVIEEMNENLRKVQPKDSPLFPDLMISRKTSNDKRPGEADESSTIRAYSGRPLNNIWRPWKDCPGRFPLYICSLAFVICGSSLPAIFLSATNRASVKRVFIGCRSLSWILISTLRILSCILDPILNWMFLRRTTNIPADVKRLWFFTIFKDGFVVLVAFLLVFFEQVGVYNNCWCRASFTGYININPYTPDELHWAKIFWASLAPSGFVFSLLLALWILLSGNRRTGVICRSQDQLTRDGKELFGYQNNDGNSGRLS